MDIRLMKKDDLKFALRLARNEGWGVSIGDFVETFEHDPYGCFISQKGDVSIGMVFAVPYASFGCIGNLIVEPDYRGRGIGKLLMKRAIDYLLGRNVHAILLDAVTAAIPLYQRLGFHEVCKSYRFRTKQAGNLSEKVEEVSSENIDHIMEIDKHFFGGDREIFLRMRKNKFPELCTCIWEDEEIAAYAFGAQTGESIRLGPVFSSGSNDLLIELLDDFLYRAEGKMIWTGILEENKTGIRIFQELGFEVYSFSTRMIYGTRTQSTFSSKLITIGHPGCG